MGRGRKSGFARKESREAKKRGANAISTSALEKPKRKQTASSATSEKPLKGGVVGGISLVDLSKSQENSILDFIYGMNRARDSGDIQQSMGQSTFESLVGGDEKALLLRTLVRDERARMRSAELASQAAKKLAKDERHRLREQQRQLKEEVALINIANIDFESSPSPQLLPGVGGITTTAAQASSSSVPLSSLTTARTTMSSPTTSAAIRFHVSCCACATAAAFGSSKEKVLLCPRGDVSVAQLIKMARNKFAVGKKFDILLTLPTKSPLKDEDICNIGESIVVVLTCARSLRGLASASASAVDEAVGNDQANNISKTTAEFESEVKVNGPALLISGYAERNGGGEEVCEDGDNDHYARGSMSDNDSDASSRSRVDEDEHEFEDEHEDGSEGESDAGSDESGRAASGNHSEVDEEEESVGVDSEDGDGNSPIPNEPTYWRPPTASAVDFPTLSVTARCVDVGINAALKKQFLQRLHPVKAVNSGQALRTQQMEAMQTQRQSLPIHRMRSEILALVEANQISVITGETGSGKTTQLPAYLLEDLILEKSRGSEAFIICTQPRRIAAITVAERVAEEMGEKVGHTVGYQIRLESRFSPEHTRILYCTTGILLRKLQSPDFLNKVSHIIVDEVHERQVETDFLMTILKKRAHAFPHLKMIMMSATLSDGLFSAYFNCPVLHISGRTFPVEIRYLKDAQAMVKAAQRIDSSVREDADFRGKGGSGAYKKGYERGADRGVKSVGDILAQFDAGVTVVPSTTSVLPPSNNTAPPPPQLQKSTIKKPKFDAEVMAELVIRIIQTYSAPSTLDKLLAAGENDTKKEHLEKDAGKENAGNPIRPSSPTDRGDAILVFLSGLQHIDQVGRALRRRRIAAMKAQVYPLHSSLQPHEQRRVFARTKPGEWKIVLSTNIAETSVTVDDVTHVVDCGFVKEMSYNPSANMSSLQQVFVSRASASQRSGRAGRVRAGTCWRLYSREFFSSPDPVHGVMDFPLPEIKRIPIEEVVLQVLLLELGQPQDFLGDCPEPPSSGQVSAAINTLLEVKAVLPLPSLPLTALGYHLARLPVDVRLGKMLIMASMLGCVEPTLTIAAALCGKSPFVTPPEKAEEAYAAHCSFIAPASQKPQKQQTQQRQALKHGHGGAGCTSKDAGELPAMDSSAVDSFFSDHIAVVKAYEQWEAIYNSSNDNNSNSTASIGIRDASVIYKNLATDPNPNLKTNVLSTSRIQRAQDFCRDKFLSHAVLLEISALRVLFRRHLFDAGFLTAADDVLSSLGVEQQAKTKSMSIDGPSRGFHIIEERETQSDEHCNNPDQPDQDEDDEEEEEAVDSSDERLQHHALKNPQAKRTMSPGDPSTQDTDSSMAACNYAMLRAVICAGLVPNIVRVAKFDREKNENGGKSGKSSKGQTRRERRIPARIVQADGQEVFVHNASLAHRHVKALLESSSDAGGAVGSSHNKDAFIAYYKKVATNKIYLYDCTAVPAISLLLFGGDVALSRSRDKVRIAGWIQMKISERHAVLLKKLQIEIDNILRLKVENPFLCISAAQRALSKVLEHLLVNSEER